MNTLTNFQVIAEKACRPAVGDVFEFLLADRRLLGRVMSTDGKGHSSFPPRSVVMFVFGPVDADWTLDHREALQISNALFGPVMTDDTAWKRRYFKTLTNTDFLPGERPAALAFKTSIAARLNRAIVDEHYNLIDPPPGTPIGQAGDTPHLAIDDLLSTMLGIPRATDGAKPSN